MTTYVINTFQDTTESLTGVGDTLLVTSAGALVVNLVGGIGLISTGDDQEITIDGLVYSAGENSGTAVSITGTSTTLFVNGQVQGDTGVDVLSPAGVDSVTVGSQGSIDSVSGGFAVTFYGNTSSPSATNDSLSNAGGISGSVLVEDGGGDLIDNSGHISAGSTVGGAIEFFGNVATETVKNSGTIDGYLYLVDQLGTTSNIDNEGTITSSAFAIQSFSDILDINNSGTIHGGLNSTSAVDVENSGHWHDGTGSGGVAFSLSSAGDSINNAHDGRITGAITLLSGRDVFANAGDIDGAITFTGTNLNNTFTNSGAITGNLTLSGSDNRFTNSGSITGNVAQVNGTDPITNHGQIYGNITLAAADALTNTGVVHGNVTLGNADAVDSSRGEITGAIIGYTSDLFEFSGNFGNETIDKFIGLTGSTHDTIQFAANDFGSFTAVQKAMSQIGSDVVIRLDATDSITLASVTLSNLVSADFKFV
jgi:trimeric autotransporter adhesin